MPFPDVPRAARCTQAASRAVDEIPQISLRGRGSWAVNEGLLYMYVLKIVPYNYRKKVETSESLALFNVTNTGEFFPTNSSDLVDSWRERPRLSKDKDWRSLTKP